MSALQVNFQFLRSFWVQSILILNIEHNDENCNKIKLMIHCIF